MTVSFKTWCKAYNLPEPVPEYRFLIDRKWRFDWCWPKNMVALEINGGIFRKGGGAHTGMGHLRDMEKFNAAQLNGWVVLQFTPDQIKSGEAAPTIYEAINMRSNHG